MKRLVFIPKYLIQYLACFPLTFLTLELIFVFLYIFIDIPLESMVLNIFFLPLNRGNGVFNMRSLLLVYSIWTIVVILLRAFIEKINLMEITRGRYYLVFVVSTTLIHTIALIVGFIRNGWQDFSLIFMAGVTEMIVFICYTFLTLFENIFNRNVVLSHQSELKKILLDE